MAVAHRLFLEDGEQVLTAAVRATESEVCDQDIDPQFDVTFQLRDRSEPVVVTVGETTAGRLAACSY